VKAWSEWNETVRFVFRVFLESPASVAVNFTPEARRGKRRSNDRVLGIYRF
jgi:hypothetical protein